MQQHLAGAGVETLIHYPVALHEQRAFAALQPAPCPAAAGAARELFSLPLHPGLGDADVERVASAARSFQKGRVLA